MADRAKAVEEVNRIRRLLAKGYNTYEVAKMTGRAQSGISHIQTGRRHRNTGALVLNDLGLRRGTGKLCRRCGEPRKVFTHTGLCLECEALELAKRELLIISAEEDESETQALRPEEGPEAP